MQASPTYEKVNPAWKTTCKAVLGGEIGELKDFGPWLKEYLPPAQRASSCLSGKEITLTSSHYCPGAKFLSFEEVDFRKQFVPLSINEIKDIDSLVEAVQERSCYTGNVVLGNSQLVEKSSNVMDSQYVYESTRVSDSRHVAYGDGVRTVQYAFGNFYSAQSSHVVKCTVHQKLNRCFECHMGSIVSSDCYYCADLSSCSDCLFSFGTVGKRHLIGNLQLEPGKYEKLKSKLMGEIREKLEKDKRIFSLFELIEKAGAVRDKLESKEIACEENMAKIDEAFQRASALILGKPLSGLGKYQKFLQKNVPGIYAVKSPFSGSKVQVGEYLGPAIGKYKIKPRLVTYAEILEVGEKAQMAKGDLSNLTVEAGKLAKILAPVAFATPDLKLGNVNNVIESSVPFQIQDGYKLANCSEVQKCANCQWARESEYIFGSHLVWYSSFALKCHSSKKISRCFELDSCENCTDLYYGHNCENVHDSMFCFNVKNLRNAIGNAALPPVQYAKLKKSLLEQLVSELEKNKDLRWDIYNVGCAKNQR